MSFVSTIFLFLFLPIAIGIYFLIPCKKGLGLRNLLLLLVSLFFYAWGEPICIFLLLLLILVVRLLGKMAENGRNSVAGKWAVALAVLVNIATLLGAKHLTQQTEILPIGLSFFAFHAIAYVVDIYRGQCRQPKSILNTALYLSVFFKMLQGPIITYREFEPQITQRTTSWNDFGEGIWRFAIGLGKKMIIAANLSPLVKYIFASDFQALSLADAWIGSLSFLVYMYFDFSGYSDMAIGLGRVFGFKVPENFNYPFTSTSVAEYWRRWHITLIAWFRDYLYYPILLGPSVKFRKYLLRHHVKSNTAKTLQNIFVPACVWFVTALWHGTNWNYTLWGLLNCAAIVTEPYFMVVKSKGANRLFRWLGVMLFLFLTVPLINTKSLTDASLYLKAMFAGNGTFAVSWILTSLLQAATPYLLIGVVGCFPVLAYVKKKYYPSHKGALQMVWDGTEMLVMMAVVVLALAFVMKSGDVWFMYQQ